MKTTTMIEINKIDFTPRGSQLEPLINSMRKFKYDQTAPIVVEQSGIRYTVLSGNRRMMAATAIMKESNSDSIFPDGTILCIVRINLTDRERQLYRMDFKTE